MTLKKKYLVGGAELATDSKITNASRFRVRKLPAAGALVRGEDVGEKQETIF